MDNESAVELLLALSKPNAVLPQFPVSERAAARSLVERIGHMPIAIAQMASVIATSGNTFDPIAEIDQLYGLPEIFDDSGNFTTMQNSLEYPYNLSNVWNVSIERLEPDQKRLLEMMSFLDPDSIPNALLNDAVGRKDGFFSSKLALVRARAGLLRSSLIEQNDQAGELRMHRLVQTFCRLNLEPAQHQRAFDLATSIVTHAWPVTPPEKRHNKQVWPAQQICLPHIQALAEVYEQSQTSNEDKRLVVDTLDFSSLLHHGAW